RYCDHLAIAFSLLLLGEASWCLPKPRLREEKTARSNEETTTQQAKTCGELGEAVHSRAIYWGAERGWQDSAYAFSSAASTRRPQLCVKEVAPPTTNQSNQPTAHEKKRSWFRNCCCFAHEPAEACRIFSGQDKPDTSDHDNERAASERTVCRKWPTVGSKSDECTTVGCDTPRSRWSDIDSLIDRYAGRGNVVGDQNTGSGERAERHSG